MTSACGYVLSMTGVTLPTSISSPRTTRSSNFGVECLRDLHREGADASGGAVDQDLLPGSNIAVIAKGLEGDEPGHGNGRGLLEGEVGRLGRQCVFGDGCVLGKGPTEPTAPAEDLLTGLKAPHARADGFDRPSHVRPSDGVLWLAQPVYRAGDVRQAAHDRPVARVHAGRMHVNQDLVFADLGLVDVPEFQDIG